MVILSDENCFGHATLILYALERTGLRELLNIELVPFEQAGLPEGLDDESVWNYCQTHRYLLLTGNRSAKDGKRSLEMVLRRMATESSLPVLTIGDIERVRTDPQYCERCAHASADITWGIEQNQQFVGTPRLYIPFGP